MSHPAIHGKPQTPIRYHDITTKNDSNETVSITYRDTPEKLAKGANPMHCFTEKVLINGKTAYITPALKYRFQGRGLWQEVATPERNSKDGHKAAQGLGIIRRGGIQGLGSPSAALAKADAAHRAVGDAHVKQGRMSEGDRYAVSLGHGAHTPKAPARVSKPITPQKPVMPSAARPGLEVSNQRFHIQTGHHQGTGVVEARVVPTYPKA